MGGFGISVLAIIVKIVLWPVPMMRSECEIPFVLVSQLVELVHNVMCNDVACLGVP